MPAENKRGVISSTAFVLVVVKINGKRKSIVGKVRLISLGALVDARAGAAGFVWRFPLSRDTSSKNGCAGEKWAQNVSCVQRQGITGIWRSGHLLHCLRLAALRIEDNLVKISQLHLFAYSAKLTGPTKRFALRDMSVLHSATSQASAALGTLEPHSSLFGS